MRQASRGVCFAGRGSASALEFIGGGVSPIVSVVVNAELASRTADFRNPCGPLPFQAFDSPNANSDGSLQARGIAGRKPECGFEVLSRPVERPKLYVDFCGRIERKSKVRIIAKADVFEAGNGLPEKRLRLR
jgi:hypothetical protein